jgi:HEPN domain-containing protein
MGARGTVLLTHSLVEMVQEGEKQVKKLTCLLDQARELDLHYILSRYPNGLPSGFPHQFYGKKVADHALIAAEKFFLLSGAFINHKKKKRFCRLIKGKISRVFLISS